MLCNGSYFCFCWIQILSHLVSQTESSQASSMSQLWVFCWLSMPTCHFMYLVCKFPCWWSLKNIKNSINLSQENRVKTKEMKNCHIARLSHGDWSWLSILQHHLLLTALGNFFFSLALVTIHCPPSTSSLSLSLCYTHGFDDLKGVV